MSRVGAHLRLLFAATAFWAFYYLGGLWSDYYQTTHWLVILVFGEALPAALLIAAGPGMMRSFRTTPARAALLCSLWWTVPFLVYDYVILRLHQGQEWSYLWRYWYLTGFTLIPPLVFGALALRKPRREPETPAARDGA